MCSLGHYLGFTYWNLLDVVLLAIGLWRIYTKQSILWMLILAADFVYTQCLRYQHGVSVNASTTFPAIFAYSWGRGLWGVFQYRHYKKAAPATAATSAALAPDLTGEICTRWNERESTWRKSGSCQSRGTSQSKS